MEEHLYGRIMIFEYTHDSMEGGEETEINLLSC